MDNDFLLLLQAKLEEASLKGVKGSLDQLKKEFEELKIKPVLDQQALSDLSVKINKLFTDNKITISNVNIDTNQAVKNAKQGGQQIVNSLNQSAKQISLDKEVNKQVKSLMESYGINGKKAFNEIKSALVEYHQELLNTSSSTKEFDNIFDMFADNSSSIDKVTSAIANNLKVANDAKSVYQSLIEYIGQTNKNGSKIYLPNSIKSEYGEDFNRMRSILGSAFTNNPKYKSNLDFENFITELNSQLGNVIDMSHGAEAAFGDLVNKVKSAKGSNYLSTNELFGMGYLNKTEMISQIDSCINSINHSEKELAQQSSVAANNVVQNERRKQQAIQDTAKVQEQLVKNGNIIQQTDFATSFNTKDEAETYFNTLSKIVHIQEKLGENKNLNSFIVEVKNAKGAVEKLIYKYNELTGTFEYSGGSINNNGVQKQIDAIYIKASRLQDTFNSLKSKYSDLNASNPIKEQTHITELENQYKKVEQAIKSVKVSDSATFSSMVSNAESEIKALQRMGEEFKRAETISMRMNGSDISSGLAQAQERFQKLKANSVGFEQMTETIQKLDAAIATVGDKSSLKTFVDQLKVAEAQLDRVKAETKSMSQVNKIQLSMETGGYESKIESLIAKTQQWTDANGNARISTTALSTALNNLGDASKALSNNNTVENQKALIAAEKELDTQIKKVTSSVRIMNTDLAKDTAVASLHSRVEEFMSKNGKAVKYFGNELKKILNETTQGAEVSKTKLAQLEQSFSNIGVAARNAGKLGKTFFQTLREGMSSFSYWTSSTFLVMKAIQSVKNGIGTVKNLDTALVDLKKTTTMTNSELEDFYYSSNKVAKQMGVTTKEIISQASAWSRLGFSTAEQATKMAQLSSQFALISPGLSIDDATSGLVSIIKAYDVSVSDVLDGIESKINIIGNNLALSNANIISMLQDSVSAMAEGRNTLEETIALEAAAYEITQNENVGNGFKTVALRLRGLNEETETLDDSLKTIKGDLYDLTGVSIMEDETTYKSTYQILKEISEVWDSLADTDRAAALELMFGKMRANIGAAVLKNFSAAEKAMDLMADSAGDANRELSTVMDSLDFKLNRLSETGTSVAQNLFKRDDMKTVVDGLTSVMNVIDSLTSKLGLFGSIGLGAGLFAGVKNIGETCECMDSKSLLFCFGYALHA